MKKTDKQDTFKLLVRYEKRLVLLFGLSFVLMLFFGKYYYENIPSLRIISTLFWIFGLIYLFDLINTTRQHFRASWCKKRFWWEMAAFFFQYIIAPIWMYLVAHCFNGSDKKKSTLLGYAITCSVFAVLILIHMFSILLKG